jgi:ZIP family zinc transporter
MKVYHYFAHNYWRFFTCFQDGFLIGVTCGVSPRAGLIIGLANCLEMGFLGMALSSRVSNCTGSPPLHRYLAILIPPLEMFLASGIGAAVGGATMDIPILYIALVAFGVVALLFLVCNELLIEAKEVQGNIVIYSYYFLTLYCLNS